MLNLYEIKKNSDEKFNYQWFGLLDVLALRNTLVFITKY